MPPSVVFSSESFQFWSDQWILRVVSAQTGLGFQPSVRSMIARSNSAGLSCEYGLSAR